jgi:tRNA pseudouridine38-40 synthase
MPTYFLQLGYHGKRYAGFQVQANASSVQGEVERAIETYLRRPVGLTGSSRTDSGVHALRNYFHFETDLELGDDFVYHVNAILPPDIALSGIYKVPEGSHSRFDALSRSYRYNIYTEKNPFLVDRAWFYPYPMDLLLLSEVASCILGEHDFTSFAKKKTQVYTHMCTIKKCTWEKTEEGYRFEVEANRFLRGMVRGLVATMVRVGRGQITVKEFLTILNLKNAQLADFSAPAHGLFLIDVLYPLEWQVNLKSE